MPAYLLHLRSTLKLSLIESDLDEYEQLYLPEPHYVLSREGKTANFLVLSDQKASELHHQLTRYASDMRLEQLSLVEVGRRSWIVRELGTEDLAATDFGGEWVWRRDPESMQREEIRVRTGIHPWLRRHQKKPQDLRSGTIGVFLYLRQDLFEGSRWIDNFRDALGESARVHFRDVRSLMFTFEAPEKGDRLVFAKQARKYLHHDMIHTALVFSLGPDEKHTYDFLQSVRPSPLPQTASLPPTRDPFRPSLVVCDERESGNAALDAAVAKLRAASRSRR